MIYIDTSVVLAELFAEDTHPSTEFWDRPLVSSRLLEYETWNSIHRHDRATSHGEAARTLIESIAFAELTREILRRARDPFPTPVRTLDSMHLSTLLFLREQNLELKLATYDGRMREAAVALDVPLIQP